MISSGKVKRSAIINDIENGGLKAPHLEAIIIETQKILCCKKMIRQPVGKLFYQIS